MPLSFFAILKSAIDQEIRNQVSALDVPVHEIYDRIEQEAERNRQEWFSNRVPNLNYHLPECRLAYLFIVAAANAGTFLHVLERTEGLQSKILDLAATKQEIKICAFGAGPGTELLGMAKYLDGLKFDHSVSVEFHLLDSVQEWLSSWYGIRDSIKAYFRSRYGVSQASWPMIPSGNFLQCDVRDTNCLPSLGYVWNQDIYVLNFMLSEIFNDEPGLRAFLNAVAKSAPARSTFIFIERRGYRWKTRIRGIAEDAGLSLTAFEESEGTLSNEDPRDLGDVYQNLTRSPRLNWNVVYSIGEKS